MASEFKSRVDNRLASLTLSEDKKNAILAAVQVQAAEGTRKAPRTMPLRRVAAACLAAVMFFAFGCTVAAAVVPSFETLLQTIGGDVRTLLTPVNLADEKEGIRLEVVAAVNDGDSAVVFFTLQDTTGAERIDENIVLRGEELDGEHCYVEPLDFDEESGIATYRLEMLNASENLRGRKTTLRVAGILTGGEWKQDIDTGLTLADVIALGEVEHETGVMYGNYTISFGEDATAGDRISTMYEEHTMPRLVPDTLAQPVQTVGFAPIVSAGVLEGDLHLQARYEGEMAAYNRIHYSLAWPGMPEESELASGMSQIGILEDNAWWDRRYEYAEWVLETPQNVPAEDVRVVANTATFTSYCAGEWNVTFTLEDDPVIATWRCDINMGGWRVHRIELSSIGVAVFGKGEIENEPVELEVVLKDGSTVRSYSSSTSSDMAGKIVCKDGFANLIHPEDVAYVRVNGQTFTMEDAK